MLNWREQRVLVTGAAGFLGNHVVQRLRDKQCRELTCVEHRQFDLSSESDVAKLFAQHPSDIVIHLAGLVGGIGANVARPAEYFYQNLCMGVLTMHYAWKSGAKMFVAAGAGCGYPEHAPMPLLETSMWDGLPQKESAPYSLAKRMLQVQSQAYWRQYKFPAVITVPGNIYGPFDNFDLEASHVVPALVRKFVEATDSGAATIPVWGSGKATRDFVYAGDVAAGILLAAEQYQRPELVNLSSGKETSILEVVEALIEITGFKGAISWDTSRPDGQDRRLFSIAKAEQDLGYIPRVGLVEGLRLTVDWYRTHRRSARNQVAAAVSAR